MDQNDYTLSNILDPQVPRALQAVSTAIKGHFRRPMTGSILGALLFDPALDEKEIGYAMGVRLEEKDDTAEGIRKWLETNKVLKGYDPLVLAERVEAADREIKQLADPARDEAKIDSIKVALEKAMADRPALLRGEAK